MYTDPHEAAKAVFKGDLVPRSISFAQFRDEMTTAYRQEPLTDEFLYELYAQYGPDKNAFHDFWESRPKGDALSQLQEKAEEIAAKREWLPPHGSWNEGDHALVRTQSGEEFLARYTLAPGIDMFWDPLTPRVGDGLTNPEVAASPVPPEQLPTPPAPSLTSYVQPTENCPTCGLPTDYCGCALSVEPDLMTALIEQVAGIDSKVDKVQELQNRIYRMEVAKLAQKRKNKRQKAIHKIKSKFRRRRR